MTATPRIALIAALSRNRVIGRDGGMPWHLPADLQHFKQLTLEKPLIMGRKTFDSIGKALPGRRNIVVSRQEDFSPEGADVYPALDQAIAAAAGQGEIMIAGGGEIYRQALPLAHRLYLTWVDTELEGDTRFPEFDESDWDVIDSALLEADERHRWSLNFVTYRRKPKRRVQESSA